MRHLRVFAVLIPVLVMLFACRGNGRQENNTIASQLFTKSLYLAKEYIDSLENSTDSGSLKQIFDNFNLKLTTINYQFPPDTDLDLSEDENDSLIRMFKRIDTIIDRKLKSFGAKSAVDSISESEALTDSIVTTTLPSHTSGSQTAE